LNCFTASPPQGGASHSICLSRRCFRDAFKKVQRHQKYLPGFRLDAEEVVRLELDVDASVQGLLGVGVDDI
jgi:hypothetical protein